MQSVHIRTHSKIIIMCAAALLHHSSSNQIYRRAFFSGAKQDPFSFVRTLNIELMSFSTRKAQPKVFNPFDSINHHGLERESGGPC